MAKHLWVKGQPKFAGRKKGTPNKATTDIRAFFRGLLSDPAVEQKWRDEFANKPLARIPKHLVELAYHYAHGKPREKIDLGVDDGALHFTLSIADGFGNKLIVDNTAAAGHGGQNGNGSPPAVITLPTSPAL